MREVRASARGIAVLGTAFWPDDKSNRVTGSTSRSSKRRGNGGWSRPFRKAPADLE
jgi:hypothetical protein